MKYIAFPGTYNEQVFDTQTLIISWTFNDITVQCTPDFKPDTDYKMKRKRRKIWQEI